MNVKCSYSQYILAVHKKKTNVDVLDDGTYSVRELTTQIKKKKKYCRMILKKYLYVNLVFFGGKTLLKYEIKTYFSN